MSDPSARPQVSSASPGPRVATFCISLADATRRRAAFAARAGRYGIEFRWWDAVDGRELSREALEELAAPIRVRWSRPDYHEPLKRTEVACALSHVRAWMAALRDDLDYLVVFEDDAVIMRELCIDVPDDADIVYLGDRMPCRACRAVPHTTVRNLGPRTPGGLWPYRSWLAGPRHLLARVRDLFGPRTYGEAYGSGVGTEAYCVTRRGLANLVRIFDEIYMPIDLQLVAYMESMREFGHEVTQWRHPGKPGLRGYVHPSVCYHDGLFTSAIFSQRP